MGVEEGAIGTAAHGLGAGFQFTGGVIGAINQSHVGQVTSVGNRLRLIFQYLEGGVDSARSLRERGVLPSQTGLLGVAAWVQQTSVPLIEGGRLHGLNSAVAEANLERGVGAREDVLTHSNQPGLGRHPTPWAISAGWLGTGGVTLGLPTGLS